MTSSFGDGAPALRHEKLCPDGADSGSYEIRYVDTTEAAAWASERGFLFGQDDVLPVLIAYFD